MKKKCCPKLPFRKVTHVIFDLDGTILDTENLIKAVLTDMCEKCDRTFTPALHNKTAGAVVEDIANLLIGELKLPFNARTFVAFYNQITHVKCGRVKFMPGAEELIKHFAKHGVPIAVATSSAEDLMLLKTERHRNVFNLFDHIVCGGSDPEVKAGKPAPDIFLVCARRFPDKPDPANCLVLEDSPNGIRGALSAGMQAVMIPQDDVPYEIWKDATLRLDSLEDMAPELFGLPPLAVHGVPVPKISFTMHYDGDEKKREGDEKKREGDEKKREGDGENANGEAEKEQVEEAVDFWLVE